MESDCLHLSILSFNMHGFYQGFSVIEHLIKSDAPDILLLQEHWLTPANMDIFGKYFPDFFTFGCSAMSKQVESGILRGRPFGGVITLINNRLRNITETIFCDERYSIVRVANYFIVNLYLPCVGTTDRLLICENVSENVQAWRDRYSMCDCIIAGDFNVDLDGSDAVAQYLTKCVQDSSLARCDKLYRKVPTYVNDALGHSSCIDYILVSCPSNVYDFAVLDPDVNFSDHLPLKMTLLCYFSARVKKNLSSRPCSRNDVCDLYLRWDKADLKSFYAYTGCYLSGLCDKLDDVLINFCDANNRGINFDAAFQVDALYNDLVNILRAGDQAFVPRAKKNFYKFWWTEELDLLKKDSMDTNKLWKAAGKPRSGPIFTRRQSSRLLYRKRLRDEQKAETYSYSNDLHEALIRKDSVNFWKCWRAKLDTSNRCAEVGGCVDSAVIVNKFANHFSSSYRCSSYSQADNLRIEYERLRGSYCGHPVIDNELFETEVICRIISNMKRGKAPGIDGLSVEHLSYSHPALPVVISKLFKLIFACGYVPGGFKQSYIVPIPKIRDCRTKAMTYDDFRGIAISPVVSKVFEHCLLDYFQTFLNSGDNQFGFKKGVGCSHAIQTVRNVVDQYIKAGYTANLCAIDLSKAFDKINHHALFTKLMKRHVPNKLLGILENWLSGSHACVKWNNLWSYMFKINFGVRQGSVLSPVLFAIYIDEVCNCSKFYRHSFVILYADDILLLSPSVSILEKLFTNCEVELTYLDMTINSKKSCCLRIGPRCDKYCKNICTSDGNLIPWVEEMRYLGIFIVKSRIFKCSLDHAKRSFYRAVNGIFGKIGRIASEEVILELIKTKCLPVLLYGLEACPLSKTNLKSLDFPINRFFMKLFNTSDMQTITECQMIFGVRLPSAIIAERCRIFSTKYEACNNLLHKLSLCPM